MLIQEISQLIRMEFVMEFRQKNALNGILLYLASTIFICYLSFNLKLNQLQSITWNALFWIIILFAAVNAVAKSFLQQNSGRLMYLYQMASATSIIVSKTVYYALLMIALSLLGYGLFSLVLGSPVQDHLLFMSTVVLAAMGLAAALTLISSIAAKAQQNQMLVAVLGLPILIPIILMTIKISKNALDGLDRSVSYDEILTLAAVDGIIITLGVILFPYVWRS